MSTQAYWEQYHAEMWEARGGPAQSEYFMRLILDNIPEEALAGLARSKAICDFGCAFGDGTALLAKRFPNAQVLGVDFSSAAIARATERFPDVRFCLSDEVPFPCDAIIASNVLEHYEDWQALMRAHLSRCLCWYIALVPYEERLPLCEDHRVRFGYGSFPEAVGSWVRFSRAVLATDSRFWRGAQLLVTYRRSCA